MGSCNSAPHPPRWLWVVVLLVGTLLGSDLNGADKASKNDPPFTGTNAGPSEIEANELSADTSVLIDEATDGVELTLRDAATLKEAVTGSDRVEKLHQRWIDGIARLDEKYGLRFTFDYNALVQYATEARGENLGSAGEIRGTFRWRPWGREGPNRANIVLQGWHRHGYSESPPSALGNSIGSLWPTARGFNDRGWALNHFYFEQYLAQAKVALRGGWTRVDSMLDVHALRAQRVFFLNSGVTDNPAVPFPSSALTGLIMYRPVSSLKFKAAISEADSRQLQSTRDSSQFLDNFFAAAQVGWTPKLFDRGESLLQAMYWHRSSADETGRPDGDGVSLLAQRRWDGKGTAFLRYSYSSSTITRVKHMVATGGGISPFPDGRPDLTGLSLAWGQPSVAGVRDQYVVEAFYRLQLTPEFQLTPDIEFIINPPFNNDHDFIIVFGLRARLLL